MKKLIKLITLSFALLNISAGAAELDLKNLKLMESRASYIKSGDSFNYKNNDNNFECTYSSRNELSSCTAASLVSEMYVSMWSPTFEHEPLLMPIIYEESLDLIKNNNKHYKELKYIFEMTKSLKDIQAKNGPYSAEESDYISELYKISFSTNYLNLLKTNSIAAMLSNKESSLNDNMETYLNYAILNFKITMFKNLRDELPIELVEILDKKIINLEKELKIKEEDLTFKI